MLVRAELERTKAFNPYEIGELQEHLFGKNKTSGVHWLAS